jgi:hypothetical protein
MVILGFFGIFIWRLNCWKLYLIIGISAGFVMMLMIPLGGVPDEVFHINSAYSFSNMIMGIKNTVSTMPMRYDDFILVSADYGRNKYLNVGDFEIYISQIAYPLGNESLVNFKFSSTSSLYFYIIPALGISLGRVLRMGSYATLMLGRILNFCVFIAMAAYAIHVTPIKQFTMMIVLLMPMTVHQGMSYSYDVYTIGLSAILVLNFK